MSADNTTAIHEAGHAVAHIRLGILQDRVTIEPKDGVLGSAMAEGAGNVWDAEAAANQAIAFCSGYAALVAAGHDQPTALAGADDDFEQTEYLISFWGLQGGIADWRNRAVELMAEPRNMAAVSLIAGHLEQEKTISGDVLDLLVDLSDGNCSQADFDRYMLLRASTRSDELVD
jgi:hypothetical protein